MILKFRYVYGIPGKPETYFFRHLSIEEIERANVHVALFLSDKRYRIIARDQFTGLLDKNSKEVYENDIVRASDDESPIEYSKNDFQFLFYSKISDEFYGLPFLKGLKKFKITGNTHGVKK